uniref:Solute carrier family 17 member 4 n=1 Tax=Suricata suricatta TaxID=37032 RepID=A0A673TPZ8_SURSU
MNLSIAIQAMVNSTALAGPPNTSTERPPTAQGSWNETLKEFKPMDCSPVWSLPIKAMMRSLPLWTILVFHFTEFWTLYIFMDYTPTYLSTVLQANLRDSGILMSLLLAAAFICTILEGLSADFLLSRKLLRLITIRKLSTAIGKEDTGRHGGGRLKAVLSLCVCPDAGVLVPSAVLVSLHWFRSSLSATMALLVLSHAATTFCQIGAFVNFLDIAPR